MVSVVIPLYNKAPHIRRAVDSVLAQTFGAFELIVVDDGSTDGGGDVVRQYTDPRVRLVRQANAGVSAARNRGVREANADQVAFLDADDEWLPRFLEMTHGGVLIDPQPGAVFSNCRCSDAATAWIPACAGGVIHDYFAFWVANNGHGMSSSSVMTSKRVLSAVGGFPTRAQHGEDLDTWARIAWAAPVVYVPEVLAVYHVDHGRRAMNAGGVHTAKGLIFCLNNCIRRLHQGQVPEDLRRGTRSYAHMLRYMVARELKDAGETTAAIRAVVKAFPPMLDPGDMRRYAKALIRSACPNRLLAFARMRRRGCRRGTVQ